MPLASNISRGGTIGPHTTDACSGGRRVRATNSPAIDIALVNNMPDTALRATERQFTAMIRAAAGAMPVRIRMFSLVEIKRGEEAETHMRGIYAPIGDLFLAKPDALIVTGAEPKTASLADEPYFGSLARLIDWADDANIPSIWSCLAAHAAVLYRDGIVRERLAEKRAGIFECRKTSEHGLLRGVTGRIFTPHSRYNELGAAALQAKGYEVLTQSDAAGVDLFVREGQALSVYFQGHPEYETDTLLREYRRDAGRYLAGESDTWPQPPQNYFSPEAASILRAFERRARANRDAALMQVFPNVAPPFAITNRWQSPAARIYRNWLDHIAAQKAGLSAAAS